MEYNRIRELIYMASHVSVSHSSRIVFLHVALAIVSLSKWAFSNLALAFAVILSLLSRATTAFGYSSSWGPTPSSPATASWILFSLKSVLGWILRFQKLVILQHISIFIDTHPIKDICTDDIPRQAKQNCTQSMKDAQLSSHQKPVVLWSLVAWPAPKPTLYIVR